MKKIGGGFYWQDVQVGEKYETWGRTVLEADICSFINLVGLHEVVFSDRQFLKEKSAASRILARPCMFGIPNQ